MVSIGRLGLYFHTLRYLKPIQFVYRVKYALRNKLRGASWRNGFTSERGGEAAAVRLQSSIAASPQWNQKAKTFRFLNQTVSFEEIYWNESRNGKLWCYNLNYHEFLLQDDVSCEAGLTVLKQYAGSYATLKDGLEPYPLSLRIIHWIKFFTKHDRRDSKLETALWHQVQLLTKQLEYHLLGNHLLENGFALFFAAAFFHNEGLYQLSNSLLRRELNEQVLADGAHFELSPMYHQLMTYRVLDCYNLLITNEKVDQLLLPFLAEKARRMLGWLAQITFRSGRIPLLNDSAEGINPTSHELFDYAQRLGLPIEKVDLADSGYRKLVSEQVELVFDVGRAGPDYIPGHAHSDALNVVCEINEQPFLVDTGTSTYETCPRRQHERSTAAHNTVQFGAAEQLEIWGSFRVARRNTPIVEMDTEGQVAATIQHATIKGTHRRSVHLEKGVLELKDTITGKEKGTARFHLHPECTAQLNGEQITTSLATFDFIGATAVALRHYQYAPEFNKTFAAQYIEIHFEKSLTTTIKAL